VVTSYVAVVAFALPTIAARQLLTDHRTSVPCRIHSSLGGRSSTED
jgi:hypothetical protein